MTGRRPRRAPTLGELIDREVERVSRSYGLRSQRSPASRTGHERRADLRAVATTPPAASASTQPPEVTAYLARFPPFPVWMRNLEPEDLILDVDPSWLPCMADAEDGEQPWDLMAFPFTGPPDIDD